MTHEHSQSLTKRISDRYFELLLVTMILAGTLVIHHLVGAQHIMLHFYYLPVIIAAHYLGRRIAGTTALFAFLAVATFALVDSSRYLSVIDSPLLLGMTLCLWGAFLGLCAILVGTLCDQRAAHVKELREAHMGIIEVLSKYLQAADQYTKSHSMRVADLAEAIANQMDLKPQEVEDIRVGALLHDIGKVEVSTHLIQKAAGLTEAEQCEMATHTFHGAELVRSLGSILQGAIPIILHHHDHYAADSKAEGAHGDGIPLGAQVVAVADAYDAIITDRPYRKGRTPQEAAAVICQCSGKQFNPEVVRAFERVMIHLTNQDDAAQTDDSPRESVVAGATPDSLYNIEIPPPASDQEAQLGTGIPTLIGDSMSDGSTG